MLEVIPIEPLMPSSMNLVGTEDLKEIVREAFSSEKVT